MVSLYIKFVLHFNIKCNSLVKSNYLRINIFLINKEDLHGGDGQEGYEENNKNGQNG